MALEAVFFQEDPNFVYGSCKDYFNYNNMGCYDDVGLIQAFEGEQKPCIITATDNNLQFSYSSNWENSSSPPSLIAAHNNNNAASSSLENPIQLNSSKSRRKRRRAKTQKNRAEMENQRMTHIAVERNRRRQMNDYLSILRSLMPPSYSQRGDQASIVGGAINFVKELEQLLQSLESRKPTNPARTNPLSGFFTFPQYTTSPIITDDDQANTAPVMEMRSGVADIEVNMVDTHANIKILTKRQPKQLLKMVTRFQSLGFTILHLNITTLLDQSVLYSLSVKVEDECQLSTVNEIATAVHEIVGMIQQETTLIREIYQ